jgi:hypothetical protein
MIHVELFRAWLTEHYGGDWHGLSHAHLEDIKAAYDAGYQRGRDDALTDVRDEHADST